MSKYLREIVSCNSSKTEPMNLDDLNQAPGNRDFIGQHSVEKHADRVGNKDDIYKAGSIKQAKMKRHGLSDPVQKLANEEKIKRVNLVKV